MPRPRARTRNAAAVKRDTMALPGPVGRTWPGSVRRDHPFGPDLAPGRNGQQPYAAGVSEGPAARPTPREPHCWVPLERAWLEELKTVNDSLVQIVLIVLGSLGGLCGLLVLMTKLEPPKTASTPGERAAPVRRG